MTDTTQPATYEQIENLLQWIRHAETQLAAWRARDAESEAFLVHQQQRAEADEVKLLEYEGYKLNFDAAIEQRDAAEARCARMTQALRFYAEGWPLGVEWDKGECARIALSAPDAQATTCEWRPDRAWEETGEWLTACGESFLLVTGTPIENEMRFCPYCGRALKGEPK